MKLHSNTAKPSPETKLFFNSVNVFKCYFEDINSFQENPTPITQAA
jgi:hypothetical protein